MTAKIEYIKNPKEEDIAFLVSGLTQALPVGMLPVQSFGFFIRDSQGLIIAGASGDLMFGSVYTSLLWVAPDFRNKKYGRQLMSAVEDLGRSNDCSFATVNTFSFQALPFYLARGYRVEFERTGYINGSINYFLRKELK